MERRLLFTLPAGVLITGAIFLGLDFALRLPEAKSSSIDSGLSDEARPVRDRNPAVQSSESSTVVREPVHPRNIPEPLSLDEIRAGPPETHSFWDMVEPLPVESDTDHWRSTECNTPGHGGGGIAVLEFAVGADGRTKHVWVIDASSPELEQCAIGAARKWRWQPVVTNGKPVETEGVRRLILFGKFNQTTD